MMSCNDHRHQDIDAMSIRERYSGVVMIPYSPEYCKLRYVKLFITTIALTEIWCFQVQCSEYFCLNCD